jgi:choline-glycine betaine transporter
VVDACAIIAVVAGTVGPIGFLGLQVSYGLQDLFGIVDNFTTQAAVIAALVGLYTISAVTGIEKGIQILSRINVIMAAALLVYLLLLGPTSFILKNWAAGFTTYISDFIPMAMYHDDPGWLGWWTVFFWGWFLG